MMLNRDRMISQALDGFFLALNSKDIARLRKTFTPDCPMFIPSSGLVYKNARDMIEHLEDFTQTFATIDFHDFTLVPDPESKRLAATFTVTLIDDEGEVTEMRNANFFEFAENHRISRVLIIATQPLDKGFQIGRS